MARERAAIVTAASRGIGAACARELAARGFKVCVFARSEAVHEVAQEIGGIGVRGSVLSPDDLEQAVNAACTHFGRLDAVINNTGHIPGFASTSLGPAFDGSETDHKLLSFTDEDWHHALDMMALNVVRMSRIVTPIMTAGGGGSIVNISTFAAKEPSSKFPLEPCIRMALRAFAKLYSDRYARVGIRMNNVLPGYMDNHDMDDALRSRVPMGRPCSMQELARTVGFLASQESSYLTGQSIVVDGGLTRAA
jgi:NAD(P)-dependent dehydrogenase (short-subunit alcohol dehydrogenase family)